MENFYTVLSIKVAAPRRAQLAEPPLMIQASPKRKYKGKTAIHRWMNRRTYYVHRSGLIGAMTWLNLVFDATTAISEIFLV